jgi:enoyl-CoA hydratase/carnithine racemase
VIEVTRSGAVSVVRMAHGKANALDVELCDALTARLVEYAQSDGGALVITGEGRMFSAGVDLVRIVNGGADYVRTFLPALNRMCATLFDFEKPVVAAVNGHAIAGGCIIACAADYRLMARDAGRIGIPELLVGVPFPVEPLEVMRFAAPRQLHAMIVRGLTLAPEEALQHGLVDAIVDADRLLAEAIAVAESLAAVPASAFALTKRQLREPAVQRMRTGAEVDAAVEDAWASPEILRAIGDYVARTLKR